MAKISSAEYLAAIEKRDRRIAELEAERSRLCQCIADDAPRKALVALVARCDETDVVLEITAELANARKALADTEAQGR